MENVLPHSIICRKEMGFPIVLEPRTTQRGLQSSNQSLLSIAQVRDHGKRIRRLLNLEIWMRMMLDGKPVEGVAESAKRAQAIPVH